MSEEAQPTDPSPNSPLAALIPTSVALFDVVVLGLHAPRKTGKTSIADALLHVALSNLVGFRRLPFAEPLRRRVASLVADPERAFVEKEQPIPELGFRSVREAMENEGDYVRQMYGRHHLVRLWSRRVAAAVDEAIADFRRMPRGMPGRSPVVLIVADDVRTAEEVQAIRDAQGYVFELHRRGVDYGDRHRTDSRLPEECIDLVWELPTADLNDLEAQDELLEREAGRMLNTVLKLRGIKA